MRTTAGPLALAAAAALGAAGVAGPAAAALTVLSFDGNACTAVDGGPANQACTTNGQFIGADYGSSANLAVSYDPSESTGTRLSLQWADDGYFTDDSVAYSFPGGPADELSKIVFTPAAGYEVSFRSFQHDKLTATTSSDFIFKVLAPNGTELFSGGINDTHVVNTAYFAGPVTFLFGNGGRGLAAVDDVTVDVRVGVAAIPEPGAWALMILGFGGAGAALRRRRGLAAAA